MTSIDLSNQSNQKGSLLHYFKKLKSPTTKTVSDVTDVVESHCLDQNGFKEEEEGIDERLAAKESGSECEQDPKKSTNVTLKSPNDNSQTNMESNDDHTDEKVNVSVFSHSDIFTTEMDNPLNDSQKENNVRHSSDDQNNDADAEPLGNERTTNDTCTNDFACTPVRRSARIKRLSDVKRNAIIEIPVAKLDNEGSSNSIKKRKSLSHKSKKKLEDKSEDKMSSSQSKLKLAPLFLLSKNKKNKKNKKIEIEDENDDDILIVETPDDKSPVIFISKERKAFLQSGVPEILKQKQTQSIEIEQTYPPLSGNVHVRNLSSEEEVVIRSFTNDQQKLHLKSSSLPEIQSMGDMNFEFACGKDIEPTYEVKVKVVTNDNVEKYIEEINRILPKFPVKKYYDLLISRKGEFKGHVQSADGGVDSSNCGYEHLPWTEKYGSSTGRGILGGSKDILKLKKWLDEWKKKTAVEENKSSKRVGKEKCKNKADKKADDDSDDDFVSRSDSRSDFSEEENSLPSAYLIVGPHGCGKTALVYGLAEQLNYKVFEVNASSKRSGKQITQQLEEAMRSQHVAKDQLSSMFSTFEMTRAAKCQGSESKKSPVSNKKRKADALLNFFQPNTKRRKVDDESPARPHQDGRKRVDKERRNSQQFTQLKSRDSVDAAESISEQPRGRRSLSLRRRETVASAALDKSKETAEADDDGPPSGKRRRRQSARRRKSEAVEDAGMVDLEAMANSTGRAKGLTLASCSLILFDEVDVVFDEDKGFWSAILMFLEVNKRPIILTCVDPRVVEQFGSDVEVCYMKKPSAASMAGYLSVVCLVEKLFVPVSDLKSLTKAFDFDVRRCLLWLQWQAAFSCSQLRFPRTLLPSVAGIGQGSAHVLAGPLARLPSRRSKRGVEEKSDKNKKESHECSLLEVFADEAEVETITEDQATPEGTASPSLLDTDWPRVEKWSSRGLTAALSFLHCVQVADRLRPKSKPPVADSCEDGPRSEPESMSTLSAEISDAIEATASAVHRSRLKELGEEVSGNADVLGRLPERLQVAEEQTLSAKDFYRLRGNVTKALPPHVGLSQETVCTDYIPYMSHISKSENFKRLSQSKRRFLHYYDRISLDIDEDIRELMYKDFS